jgi:site-specific DNA recombinase
MLANRIYRGDIVHKGQSYPGDHAPIVDEPLWNEVQQILSANRVDRDRGASATEPSLLAGLAFDAAGERLTPTHAVKNGTRYRYYVSQALITGSAKNDDTGQRIPAASLEALVKNRLREPLVDAPASDQSRSSDKLRMMRSGLTGEPAGNPRPSASCQMAKMPSRCGAATSHTR